MGRPRFDWTEELMLDSDNGSWSVILRSRTALALWNHWRKERILAR
jgi:hypothetical protein